MIAWNDLSDLLAIVALAIGLLAAAFGIYLGWKAWENRESAGSKSSRSRRQLKIPRDWPLDERPLVLGMERYPHMEESSRYSVKGNAEEPSSDHDHHLAHSA